MSAFPVNRRLTRLWWRITDAIDSARIAFLDWLWEPLP